MYRKTPITAESLTEFKAAYAGDKRLQAMTRVLSKGNLRDAAHVNSAQSTQPHIFSIDIKTMKATNQKSTGRCWLFAALNVLRELVGKKLNVEYFEFSQSYAAFWDKFERCNFFLGEIIDTADRPTDDREAAYILTTGVQDGGQWDMFVNIVEKYGVVPKCAMPETAQTSATGALNSLLNASLKHDAVLLRDMVKRGCAAAEIEAAKTEMLSDIYGFLCACYGEPPKEFCFEYKTKDDGEDKPGQYFIEKGCTPLSFKEEYIGNMLDDYVSIINSPTSDKPYDKLYTIRRLGNVAEAKPVKYLNLCAEEFKALVLAQLKDGEVVWFGSDCGKYGDGSINLWDDRLYDYELVTGLKYGLTKAEQLDCYWSAMNHAMVFTGVNLDGETPTRWKVENSWGDSSPNDGYHTASDTWFDKYVYQAVINKKYLAGKLGLLDGELTELDPWDPMGTLAD